MGSGQPAPTVLVLADEDWIYPGQGLSERSLSCASLAHASHHAAAARVHVCPSLLLLSLGP